MPLRIPPRAVRARIASSYLAEYELSADTLSALADLDDLLPSQLENAARLAKLCISHQREFKDAWPLIEQSVLRSRELLGQPRVALKPACLTAYSLDFVHTDTDVKEVLEGLRSSPNASFCLYGPPGTGKSLLARHIAQTLDLPVVIKRTSDLLNKYLGETEQRIAAMFEQARDEGAVLVLDEADSFFCDRTGAQQPWEVTQTNEFLTQLESFEGIFFATTNLIDKLDPAVLRRFSHKIRFDYLTVEQRQRLILQELGRLGIAVDDGARLSQRVQKLDRLTPGDVAAVLKNLRTTRTLPSGDQVLDRLEDEIRIKRHGKGSIGFH